PCGRRSRRRSRATRDACSWRSARRYASENPEEEDPMVGLWQRFMLIFKSKASCAMDRAENPTETLDYSYEQMIQQLQNVKRGVADVVTAKKRLELQTQSIEQNVVKLETQARQAVAANREDLARQALERKAAAQQQLQGLDTQGQQLADQQEKLIASQ